MANQDSLNIVQQAYDNFKTGNIPALFDQMDSAVNWQLPEIPGARISGKREGVDGVKEFFTTLAADQEVVTFEPRRFISQGDTVIALGDYEWTVKATGKNFKSDFAHVFTVRDGKIASFQEFMDSSGVADAYRK